MRLSLRSGTLRGQLVRREDWSARETTMSDQTDDLRPPWSRSDRRIPRTVLRPLQEFLQTSASSALLLAGALVLALVWANLDHASYEAFWHTEAVVRIGATEIGHDLRFWVNDGLMTIFFLVVGIEIKRELTTGELRRPKAAALPAIAAVGGMLLPAVLFLIIAGGGPAERGWGIPMATDIAFALGALALAATQAPTSLRPILLTLAIVDDIGAILVIAIFYTEGGSMAALAAAGGLVLLVIAAQRVQIRATMVYIVLGAGLWYACYRAGVHPTIAGVILGVLTPSEPFQRPSAVSAEARRTAEETLDDPEPPDADAFTWLRLARLSKEAVSPLARVEHTLLPWSAFVIVPMFALSNAGVPISAAALAGAFTGTLGLAIVVGLVVGKPVGITLFARLAAASRVGDLPADLSWRHVLGMGATAGIGFTVALFIAELAFAEQPDLLEEAKVAILVGSVAAAVIGQLVLRSTRTSRGR
jgi:NhaA family Na+:H+ antiporter